MNKLQKPGVIGISRNSRKFLDMALAGIALVALAVALLGVSMFGFLAWDFLAPCGNEPGHFIDEFGNPYCVSENLILGFDYRPENQVCTTLAEV